MERRGFIKLVALAAAGVTAYVIDQSLGGGSAHSALTPGEQAATTTVPAATIPPNESHPIVETGFEGYPPTFSDHKAEAIAEDLFITPGAYYKVPSKTIEAMTGGAFLEDNVAAIFPPSIQQYKPLILENAKKQQIPPNFIATIMLIESAGDPSAQSGSDAYGLMQVVPGLHFDQFVATGKLPSGATLQDYELAQNGGNSKISLADYQSAFTDPEANIAVGTAYLAECLQAAKDTLGPPDPDINPRTFIWAGAYYNGGIGLEGDTYGQLPTQSQLYQNHIIRLLMDVEIANRLQRSELDSEAILNAMVSDEMNARAYACGQYDQKFLNGNSTIQDYDQRDAYLATVVPGVSDSTDATMQPNGIFVQNAYNTYIAGGASFVTDSNQVVNRYVLPLAPGFRIWAVSGGDALLDNISADDTPNWQT